MEAFVQMSLETYDVLKSNNEYLKRKLKEEQELHNEDIAQINEVINDLRLKIDLYKQFILKCNCKYLNVDGYSLEQYLDIDSWTYGMNYKDEILEECSKNLAVVKGIPKSCSETDCNDCDFLIIQKDCHEIAKEWSKQPYKKPVFKLTKGLTSNLVTLL